MIHYEVLLIRDPLLKQPIDKLTTHGKHSKHGK